MRKRSRNIVLIIIAGLLLTVTYLIRDPLITLRVFVYDALINISFIILTLVILDIVWNLFGGEPIENLLLRLQTSINLVSDSYKTGLIRFFAVSGDYGSHKDWIELLKKARKHIDLAGYTLHIWTRSEDFNKVLINLIINGVTVRLMIMDPDNKFFEAGINVDQIKALSVDEVKAEIAVVTNYFNDIIDQLSKCSHVRGSIELKRIEKGLITSQICRFDNFQMVTPYLFSVNTSQCPTFEISGGDSQLFQKYVREFESLWALNQDGEKNVKYGA
ncbi:MAG TPA: hypothetical protein VN538_05110 [Clostridia bacterium]|nr:hypothetical protein [Clostridia bacterium]